MILEVPGRGYKFLVVEAGGATAYNLLRLAHLMPVPV
jgi:hypothetical protein